MFIPFRSLFVCNILILFFSFGCNSDKEKIKQKFKNWTANEIREKHFIPQDSCNEEYYNKHNKNLEPEFAIPNENNIVYYYYDFNKDEKTDALITFIPKICFAPGNIGLLTQYKILVLSNENEYSINHTFLRDSIAVDSIKDTIEYYFFIDSVSAEQFLGTCYTYKRHSNNLVPYKQKSFSTSYYAIYEIKFTNDKIWDGNTMY